MSSTDDREAGTTAQAEDLAPVATGSQDVDGAVVPTPKVRAEGHQVREGARALVFTPSRLTIFVVLVTVVGALPLLFSVPYFWLALLVPIAIIGRVLWVRTTVDPDSLRVRSLRGSRTVRWDDVRGLSLARRSSVTALLADGTELVLPSVRVRDLPALALASGGRITDPVGD